MRMVDLIRKKRDGELLTEEEIRFVIQGFTEGTIPDYQMSAFAMAVWYRGMTREETVILTDAMEKSGERVDLSCFGELSADKHSTGGVGDKTTLIIAPIVATLGVKMAKMSGRGLGHTGGTVDKLESIPGYRTTLTPEEFLEQVENVGVAVIGQSGNLTPADKKLYALRDVTATVDSMPLIASSIMSKKLAAGSKSIVLDVKVGAGAFMQTPEEAQALAEEMVAIGKACGRKVTAVLTNMDIPLGRFVGNSLEVREACEVLKGNAKGPLRDICVELSAEMVGLVFGWSPKDCRTLVDLALDSGAAFKTMKKWVRAQGGDDRVLDDYSGFKQSLFREEISAEESGWLASLNARLIGEASVLLGAGRAVKSDEIDPAAGIQLVRVPGEFVKKDEPLAVLYTDREAEIPRVKEMIRSACRISEDKPVPPRLIYGTIK